MPIYGKIGPDPRILELFEIFVFQHICLINTLATSPLWLFKHVSNSNYGKFTVFGPKLSCTEKSAQTPEFWNFFRFLFFNIFVSSICLQRALDDSSNMFLTQIIANLLLLTQNAHIWKSRPIPPNYKKIIFFCFYKKCLTSPLLTRPGWLSKRM